MILRTTKSHQSLQPAKLVLADGTTFVGGAIGAIEPTTGEVVFTTGMTGYQEVLTDPSYCGQLITMTATQIGNTGANTVDAETARPAAAGFVIHELSRLASNYRTEQSLNDYLFEHGIAGIAGVDTRALTRRIRDQGAQMGAIGTEDRATLHDRALAAPPMAGLNLATRVTTAASYQWTEGNGEWRTSSPRSGTYHVVAIDFGVKRSILRCLVDAGCTVTVVPANVSAEEVLGHGPDGIFLSNGPGDPAAVGQGITTVRELLGKKPLFGICLGHQILCLALQGRSYKLKFGHRGLNQPVRDQRTRRIEITTQNHGFCVDMASLLGKCQVSHVHLNDGTVEGIEYPEGAAFGVQYHPEGAAGPHDARYLFKRFTDRIESFRGA